ncbi:MAG: glutamyl-tRNA reductase, partial [Candidatus Latescibacteria bacterium]|nr:glutamyl-tRNA reductase [Candidatus Latescibacterota bacterium]
YLVDQGLKRLMVANRTYERAAEVARRFDGIAVSLDDGLQMIADVDIVISSTGAPHCILDRDQMTEIMRIRRNKPIFLIDIAVPRDIDPQVRNVYNTFLYDIDDLQLVVDDNAVRRKKEAENVETIVNTEVNQFLRWYQSLAVTPTITQLRQRADTIRTQEIERALSQLNHLSDSDRKTVDMMSRAIINKLLHDPTIRLKDFAKSDQGHNHLHILRHLFGLDENLEENN